MKKCIMCGKNHEKKKETCGSVCDRRLRLKIWKDKNLKPEIYIHDTSQTKIDSIYVISNPLHTNIYKVGYSNNPKTRLIQYQTCDPYRAFVIEYQLETKHAQTIEKHIHEIFPNESEWVWALLQSIIDEIEFMNDKLTENE